MSKFKCEVTLQQVTPMIHFQAEDYGACLRATDVKPRLDAFLLKRADIKKSWYIDKSKNNALDYRMTISIGNAPKASITTYRQSELERMKRKSDNETTRYIDTVLSKIENEYPAYIDKKTQSNPKSFFGNMVGGYGTEKVDAISSEYREGIQFTTPISITLFSAHTDLLNCLKDNIEGFFLINNFGTRSDKGLGSFYVKAIDGDPVDESRIEDKITDAAKSPVYVINSGSNALEVIRLIYAFMKGGINYTTKPDSPDDYFKGFIYRYFFKNGGYYKKKSESRIPRNDKAFMKRELFRDGKALDDNDESEDRDKAGYDNASYLYIRAMLGVPDYMEFRDSKRKGKVNIAAVDKSVERVPSPILFKVLPDRIYIIPGQIDKRVRGATFEFSKNGPAKKISTPADFDLIDFLDSFMEDFNDKKSPKCGSIGIKDAKSKDIAKIKNCTIEKIKYKGGEV